MTDYGYAKAIEGVCPYCGEDDIDTVMTVIEGVCWRDLCLAEYWKERNAETLRGG